jgi:hypothetical protein
MNDDQSKAADNLKILIAFLAIGASWLVLLAFGASGLVLIGIVPFLVLLIGLAIAWKTRDPSNIKVTSFFIEILFGLAAAGTLVTAGYYQWSASQIRDDMGLHPDSNSAYTDVISIRYEDVITSDYSVRKNWQDYQRDVKWYNDRQNAVEKKIGDSYNMIFVSLIPMIFLFIVEFFWRRPLSRLIHQLLAKQLPDATQSEVKNVARIMARDSLAPYSIADELLKWGRLRDEGLITEHEYQQVRQKLLK